MKRFFSICTVLCLVICCAACGSNKSDDTLSVEEVSDSASVAETVSDSAKTAVLNVNVKSATPAVFKTDRPVDAGKENISIILVIGQSNSTTSVGYASEWNYYSDGKTTVAPEYPVPCAQGTVFSGSYLSAITKLDVTHDVSKLADPSRNGSTLGGYSPSFGAMWNMLSGTKVVFIQAAVGAVGIHEWVPDPENYTCTCANNGKGRLYSTSVSIYKSTFEALKKDYNILYTGYLWNQGEHEEGYSQVEGNTVNSAEMYYKAYKSMHDGLMKDLGLDFGVISVVRSNGSGKTAAGSSTLTVARTAQYRLCNDIDNLYMGSTVSETCDSTMMDQSNTIHYSQKVFNVMGTEMAQNLAGSLGLLNEPYTYSGIEVWSHNGNKLISISADGKVDGTGFLSKSNTGGEILVKLSTLGTAYTLDYSLTVDGADASGCINEFGKINWDKLKSDFGITKITVACNVN